MSLVPPFRERAGLPSALRIFRFFFAFFSLREASPPLQCLRTPRPFPRSSRDTVACPLSCSARPRDYGVTALFIASGTFHRRFRRLQNVASDSIGSGQFRFFFRPSPRVRSPVQTQTRAQKDCSCLHSCIARPFSINFDSFFYNPQRFAFFSNSLDPAPLLTGTSVFLCVHVAPLLSGRTFFGLRIPRGTFWTLLAFLMLISPVILPCCDRHPSAYLFREHLEAGLFYVAPTSRTQVECTVLVSLFSRLRSLARSRCLWSPPSFFPPFPLFARPTHLKRFFVLTQR